MATQRRVQLSRAAARIWRMLRDRPDDYTVEQVAHEAQTSRAGVERALAELEEAVDPETGKRLINLQEDYE